MDHHQLKQLIDLFNSQIRNPKDAVQKFVALRNSYPSQELFQEHCIDVVWMNDQVRDDKDGLCAVLGSLMASNLLNERLLKERLEVDLLIRLKIIPSDPTAQSFQKKLARMNTAIHYKQTKFNLLRECIGGYSAFFNSITSFSDNEPVEEQAEKMNLFIGKYALDPNTCLDVLVDVVSTNIPLKYPLLVAYLRKTGESKTKENLANCIAHKEGNFENEANKSNLLRLACILIKDGWITAGGILSHFQPQKQEIAAHFQAKRRNLEAFLLASSSSSSSSSSSKVSLAGAPVETRALFEVEKQKHPSLILLLVYLLECDLIDHFLSVVSEVPGATSFPIVGRKLCEYLYRTLKLTRRESEWFSVPVHLFKSYQHFREGIPQFLDLVECHLSLYPALISTLLRIGSWSLKGNLDKESGFWLSIVGKYLFHSISSLQNPNQSLLNDLGNLLFHFNYRIRYHLYGRWKSVERSNPTARKFSDQRLNETRKSMRRLSKENTKQIGRTIGKLSATNPFSVFSTCLGLVQAYENLIQPLTDALKYLTPLAYDVLCFCMLECLANESLDRLKADGTNVSDWLQNLAVCCGSLCKKYSQIQLEPIIQYIVCQLNAGNSLDLIVLAEIVHKMAGCESFTNLSDVQIEALGGGPILRGEYLGQGASSSKTSKKTILRLFNSLTRSGLLFTLWILIAQQRNSIIYDAGFEHLKLMTSLLDQNQQILLQFTELATLKGPFEEHLFPSIVELLQHYHVDREVAYSLRRSIQIENPFGSFESIFWSLSLSDVFLPAEIYQAEIRNVRNELEAVSMPPGSDPTSRLKEKERDKLAALLDRLEKELASHSARVNQIGRALADSEVLKNVSLPEGVQESFVMQCVLPRACFSSADSLYVTLFLDRYLPPETKPRMLGLILDRSPQLIACWSEDECRNYGRVLRFCLSQQPLSQEERDGLLARSSKLLALLSEYLKSGIFLLIRNSIVLLTSVLSSFPLVQEQATLLLEDAILPLKAEPREDVKLMATSYASMLLSIRDKLAPAGNYSANCAAELQHAVENILRNKLQQELRAVAVVSTEAPTEDTLEMGEAEVEMQIDSSRLEEPSSKVTPAAVSPLPEREQFQSHHHRATKQRAYRARNAPEDAIEEEPRRKRQCIEEDRGRHFDRPPFHHRHHSHHSQRDDPEERRRRGYYRNQ